MIQGYASHDLTHLDFDPQLHPYSLKVGPARLIVSCQRSVDSSAIGSVKLSGHWVDSVSLHCGKCLLTLSIKGSKVIWTLHRSTMFVSRAGLKVMLIVLVVIFHVLYCHAFAKMKANFIANLSDY